MMGQLKVSTSSLRPWKATVDILIVGGITVTFQENQRGCVGAQKTLSSHLLIFLSVLMIKLT